SRSVRRSAALSACSTCDASARRPSGVYSVRKYPCPPRLTNTHVWQPTASSISWVALSRGPHVPGLFVSADSSHSGTVHRPTSFEPWRSNRRCAIEATVTGGSFRHDGAPTSRSGRPGCVTKLDMMRSTGLPVALLTVVQKSSDAAVPYALASRYVL